MDISSIALQGLQQADVQLGNAASKIASSVASVFNGVNMDTVDLSVEAMALMSAKNQFSAILSTMKSVNEIQKHSIDLMA
jgi:hypothetical protein